MPFVNRKTPTVPTMRRKGTQKAPLAGELAKHCLHVVKDKKVPYMGWIKDSHGIRHRIRIACEHWAPGNSEDCRNLCQAKEDMKSGSL